MRLREITMQDLALYEGVLTDPRMMAELGGVLPREGLREKLRGIVEGVEAGLDWFFVIEDQGEAAGWVCVWDHAEDEETITEIGWMVTPEHQGRGLGKAAVREVLRRGRTTGRWSRIHAFPGVTNAASNGICRACGFTKVEERDFEYAGRTLRGAHWVIDLAERAG